MAGPDYGALGATFKVTRALQAVSMIAIIGMTANFIAEMVSSNVAPPNVLIGTLSVVSHKTPAPSVGDAGLTTWSGLHCCPILRYYGHSFPR